MPKKSSNGTTITLLGNTYVAPEIQAGISMPEGGDQFFQDTLSFCQQWLSGQDLFTITTSGSTGTPKVISHTRAQMKASARATLDHLKLEAGTPALVCIPTRFVGGRMMLVRGWLGELPMTALAPRGNPLGKALRENVPVGFVAMVPVQMEHFISETSHLVQRLEGTKAILLGGAPVHATLEQSLQSMPCPVYHTYGMTETVSHVALRRLNGPNPDSAFHLLSGVEAETDERGCLRLRGAVTLYDWVQTNDIISWEGERSFRWLGRADNVVNSGGIKISLEPLEATLEGVWSHKERFFLHGLPDARLGQRVVLVVEGPSWSKPDQVAFLEWCKKQLPKYHAPQQIVFVSTFVETPTGKISREATVQNTNESKR